MADVARKRAPSVVSSAPSVVREAVVGQAVRVRPNVEQAQTGGLAAAFAKMQARTASDNRSWIYWAEYHGYNRFDCWHHGSVGNDHFSYDLFLPWHRAYLHYFEHVALTEDAGATLPWWDWTSATSHRVGVPASFAAAESGGEPSPLASGPVPAGLRASPNHTTRQPGAPASLPSVATIDGILALSAFDDFSSQIQNQHDFVHGWTGGDMGVISTSAFDPVFWLHHCMIDRLWYLWQVRHGVDNVPPNYLDRTLEPWGMTVKDVLDVRRLGYTYGTAQVRVASAKFAATKLEPAGGATKSGDG
jgi:tyrosinase